MKIRQFRPPRIFRESNLVTEGVLTLGKCVEYMKRYTSGDKHSLDFVLNKKDGASQLCRMLLEDCTEVQFLVGQARIPRIKTRACRFRLA